MLTTTPSLITAPTQRASLAASADALAPVPRRSAGAQGFSLGATGHGAAADPGSARTVASRADAAGSTALRSATAGSVAREPGAQQQVGRLQQGLDYLDRLAVSVQQLKSGLSDTLARRATPSALLNDQVAQLRQLWSQRATDAGGRVDGDLQATADVDSTARQRFKLRGLDLAVLTQGGRETLRLQVPGQRSQATTAGAPGTSTPPITVAVTLDGEGTPAQLRALSQALAPTGLTVQVQGPEVVFSVVESQWPALRDGLTLRGEGKRFPSGQPVRAWLEPSPQALQPDRWQLQDADGQRQALGQLLQAQPKLAKARAQLSGQLQAAAERGRSDGAPSSDAMTASTTGSAVSVIADAASTPARAMTGPEAAVLVSQLDEAMGAADFTSLGSLLPAVRGLHRQRVQQLLST
ncbi:hypothetical protein [Roseateles amylovorans]|uniref:Flagellar hook-length control protein FliK n=1 Tax=Roseateles amylovorans TaxID=2978473 RepID=A0ABY6AUH6_9BURK|nr:hypothetical protein [Roseateles amylovorans]UXH76876.1 hypothetical protein N4261_17825 [Roseateles amylovorans]